MVVVTFLNHHQFDAENMYNLSSKQFIITKKIAKHGRQAVIVIPRLLEHELKPHTIVKLTIDVLEAAP